MDENQNSRPTAKQFSAFVIGATGSVGTPLVEKLVNSPRCERVTVISRRELAPSPKRRVVVWEDFAHALIEHPEKAVEVFKGHDVGFCCLGASRGDAVGLLYNPKKYGKAFRTIDHDYVVGAAQAAHRAGVPTFSVLSSLGADPEARFFYTRIKGEMEQALQAIGFSGLSVFQPSQLMRDRPQRELSSERMVIPLFTIFNRFIPARYKGIHVRDVAEAMKTEFEQRIVSHGERVAFYPSEHMLALAGHRV